MPIHSFNCPRCGWQGDRLVKAEEADRQWCKAIITRQVEDDFPTHSTGPVLVDGVCGDHLEREVSITAAMPLNWRNW